MSSCLALDLNVPFNQATSPRPLSIALIGPNEKGRRTVASALKNSPKADVFEFDSYPPERGYIRAVMENPFNVLILELDSNTELALELIEEASECRGAAVLAYSTRSDSKLTLKALQAGALAFSISKDASELRRQVDKLAAAYSPVEEESPAASRALSSELANFDDQQYQVALQLPSVLPEDFDGWDDQPSAEAAIGNNPEVRPVLSPKLVERSESSTALVSSLVHLKAHEEEESRPMKAAPAHNDLQFRPQTASDAEETILHENTGAATERLLKISTSKLWSGILFSGEKKGTRKFDSAQLHDADHEIEEMFRRSAERSTKVRTLKRGGKIVASVSLASALVLGMGVLFWSHPQPLITVGQAVLRGPVTAIMRTGGQR